MTSRSLSATQTRAVALIVESIVPAYPDMDTESRAQALADATAFVVSQITRIPGHLLLPYKLALLAFRYLPLLRYGRPLTHLDSSTRAAYLALWSDAPLGAPRNFVKLIRSCALLAYFDHPLVMRCLEAEHAARQGETPPHAARVAGL